MQLYYTPLILSITLLVITQLGIFKPVYTCQTRSIINHSNIRTTGVLATQLKVNKSRPVSKYIFILLLANAFDTETNPGPKTPKWPCGTCGKAVTWKTRAVCCDNCDKWFHIQCQHIHTGVFRFMDASNVSWECINCGMPNFSTALFNSTYSIETENQFSNLSTSSLASSPGVPVATSSPKLNEKNQNIPSKSTSSKFKRPIRVVNINFQSICNKKPELEEIINSAKPDIIIGTETWLNPNIPSHELFPPNLYNVYRKDRTHNNKGKSYGGVLIAITKEFISSKIDELQTDCENVWAEINISGTKKIIVGSYYRPPSDDGTSLENLNSSLTKIKNISNSNIWLGGDFNLGHIDWSVPSIIAGKPEQKLHQQLLDIAFDHNLQQMVDIETRKDRTLDLFFTNNPSSVNKMTTLPPIGKADHDIVYLEIDTWLKRVRELPRKILKFNKANWENIKADLAVLLTTIQNKYKHSNVNELWEYFKIDLIKSIETNVPHKMITYKHRLPWVTDKLRKLINKKNKAYQKRKKDPEKYKKLKQIVQKELRTEYWKYIEKMICDIPIDEPGQYETAKTKPKNLFSYIKSTRSDNTGVAPLKKDGKLVTDTEEKANILNQQFQSVFTDETDDNIPDKGTSPHPKMPKITITEAGITKLLSNINPHKACGPDNINGRVLKELKEQISPILTLIFKKSLDTGETPKDWKHANVAPAFKKGEKYKPINYRPISLTCICCKLMEHIITSNIMSHLEKHHILYDLQHGFRKSRSCETQLIDFIQELARSNNSNTQTDLIIMDFAKAFDKVSHRHLLYKLKFYGIENNTLNWIQAFLQDRTQTVVINGISSTSVPVTSGVPQGTVLGPILFLIYINDLPEYLEHSKLRLFADDSIIYREIKTQDDCHKLQLDLDSAARWESDWLMAFHPDKCTNLSISQKKNNYRHNYILHNHILESVTSAKYLGITLQSNLKWNKHIDNIVSNGNRSLSFLKRNLKIANTETKSRAYQALVRPKLEYSCSVWDPHMKEQQIQLEKVQRRAARYVHNNYDYTSSVTNMLNQLKWPPLAERRLKTRLVLFYKVIHCLVAIPSHILEQTDSRTRQNHSQTYRHIQTSKDTYKWSFFPRTIIQWNLLPQTVIETTTVDSFRDQLTPAVLSSFK